MRIEEGLKSLLEDVIHFDLVVDHGLDREQSTSDHVDDPWPHRDRVTERTLNSEVLDDPLERGDLDLSLHEADHDNDALGSDGVNTRIERSAVAGAFHRGIDANAFGRVLTNPIRNGFAGRIDEDRTDIEAFDSSPTIGIGLADEDASSPGCAGGQDSQRAYRPGASHQNTAAWLQAASVDSMNGYCSGLDQGTLLIRNVVRQLDGCVILYEHQLAHAAPWPAQPDRRTPAAQKGQVATSKVTVPRPDLRLDQTRSPTRSVVTLDPDGLDAAREIVAKNLWQSGAARAVVRC